MDCKDLNPEFPLHILPSPLPEKTQLDSFVYFGNTGSMREMKTFLNIKAFKHIINRHNIKI